MFNFRTNKFLLLSCGKAGSNWVARSLHMHPEICCSMGVDHPLISLNYGFNVQEYRKILLDVAKTKILKKGGLYDEEYRFVIMNGKKLPYQSLNVRKVKKLSNDELSTINGGNAKGCAGDLADYLFSGMKKNQRKRGSDFSPEDMFSELKKYSKARCYGNVHGYTCNSGLMHKYQDYIKKNKIIIADLVRHPISRTETEVNIYKSFCHDISYFLTFTKTKIDDYPQIVRENLDNMLFYYVINICDIHKHWSADIRSLNCKRFLFEDIRSDPDYFKSAIIYLTSGKLNIDKDYIDTIFSQSNLNSGRVSNIKLSNSTNDTWSSWQDWQKELFIKKCKKYDLVALYKELGYDMSFIK
jgi:hypothetical protein